MTANHTQFSTAQSLVPPSGTVQDRVRLLFEHDSWTADDLAGLARDLAQTTRFARDLGGVSDVDLVAQARALVRGLTVSGKTPAEQVDKLENSSFWRRRLGKLAGQKREARQLAAGRVGGQTGKKYVSDLAAKHKQRMDEKQQEWLDASRVEATINGERVSIGLAEIKSKADAAKLAEFFALSSGFQQIAEKQRLEIGMLTFTMEGTYHANPLFKRKNGEIWNGALPNESHKLMGLKWARLRSGLLKHGITLSGFRAAEPHEDETPHWHILFAYPPALRGRIMAEALKRFPDKLKLRTRESLIGPPVQIQNKKHKNYVEHMRWFDTPADALNGTGRARKGREGAQVELTIVNTTLKGANSLVNYVASYVSKQGMQRTQLLIKKFRTQQAELGAGLATATGERRAESIARISELGAEIEKLQEKEVALEPVRLRTSAWRSLWAVRGLQWVGIQDSLTLWRELRRVKDYDAQHAPVAGPRDVVRELWTYARAGKFGPFLELLGGLAAAPVQKQASYRIKTAPRLNVSGQSVEKIVGVIVKDELTGVERTVITRPHQWTLITEYPDKAQAQPVAVPPVPACPSAQSDLFTGICDNGVTVIVNHPSKPNTSKIQPKSLNPTSKVGIKCKSPPKNHPGNRRLTMRFKLSGVSPKKFGHSPSITSIFPGTDTHLTMHAA